MPDFRRLAGNLIPSIGNLFGRFPVPMLIAVAITIYLILLTHKVIDIRASGELIAILSICFSWSLAATLFAESRGLPPFYGHLGGAIGAAVLIVLGAYPFATDLNLPALIFGMGFIVAIAAHTGAKQDNASFWLFNHNLWIGAAVASLASLLFYGGIAAILASLKYLFAINISARLFADFAAIAFGLIGPIAWLSLVPRRFDVPVIEGPQSEFTSYAVAALAKFILVPLLLVYALILHVYTIKIGLEGALPKGRLGWMVLSYGGVVTLTALLTFPTRDSGGVLVRWFWRFWPWLLLVPTFLLFLAVTQRIGQYGFTEKRYVVLMAGIWLSFLVVVFGLLPRGRDLRLIPGMLAALALTTAFGPWGVTGLSVRTQARELTTLLDTAGFAENGKLVTPQKPNKRLLPSDARRASNIIRYLRSHNRLELLAPLFTAAEDNPFAQKTGKTSGNLTARHDGSKANWYASSIYRSANYSLAGKIRKRLALSGVSASKRHHRRFNSDPKTALHLDGIGWITGHIGLNLRGKTSSSVNISVDGKTLAVQFDGKAITVVDSKNSTSARFDLSGNQTLAKPALPATRKSGRPQVTLDKTLGNLDAKLVVVRAYGNESDDSGTQWNNVTFYLVLTGLPPAKAQ